MYAVYNLQNYITSLAIENLNDGKLNLRDTRSWEF